MNILYLEKVNHYVYIIHAFIYNFQKAKWLIFPRVIKISMEKKDMVLHKEFFSQIRFSKYHFYSVHDDPITTLYCYYY